MAAEMTAEARVVKMDRAGSRGDRSNTLENRDGRKGAYSRAGVKLGAEVNQGLWVNSEPMTEVVADARLLI
jgi:hypothetical protein